MERNMEFWVHKYFKALFLVIDSGYFKSSEEDMFTPRSCKGWNLLFSIHQFLKQGLGIDVTSPMYIFIVASYAAIKERIVRFPKFILIFFQRDYIWVPFPFLIGFRLLRHFRFLFFFNNLGFAFANFPFFDGSIIFLRSLIFLTFVFTFLLCRSSLSLATYLRHI